MPSSLVIGDWKVDRARNELARGGESVHLEPKAIEVLAYLATRAGDVVGRDELLSAVWPGVVVGDDALTQAIIKLRKALGDDAHSPKYIETISKRGYRLIAAVGQSRSEPIPAPASRRRKVGVLAVVAATILVAVAAVLVAKGRPGAPWPIGSETPPLPPAATIAILPLSNLSKDPGRDYFSDGLTEDLINALGRFSGLRVMSHNAVETYRGRSPAPRVIRDDLGARYVVRGSVRQADGRVRVTVELSDAESGALLGSEAYEGEGAQLFEIQDRIVKHVAGALHLTLRGIEEQRVFGRNAQDLEVHDLLLRARALLRKRDRTANREARALIVRAREIAPDQHGALASLGAAEFQRATEGWIEDAAGAMLRGEEYLKQALASPDPKVQAAAHSHLAAMYSHQARLDEALAHANRAVEFNPSDSQALYWQGAAMLFLGRIDEAIAVLETSRRIDPYPSPGSAINLSLAYYSAARHREALAHADALLSKYPRNGTLHAIRAASLARLGQDEEARRAADAVRRFDPLFDPDNFGARFADPKFTAQVRDGLRMAGL